MTEATKARLERLLEITDATSLAEVVRRAIQTYEAIVEEKLDEKRRRSDNTKVDAALRGRSVTITIRRSDGREIDMKVT